MEKKKKRLIVLAVIAGVLVFVILLSSAIFKIKGVSVEYQTTLTLLDKNGLNEMVESSGIPVGKSIFFSTFDESISKMEKDNPYVKINGIERKFPNSLVVLVSERVPVVRVEHGGLTYVLDNELKVLNAVKSDSEYNSKTGEKDLPLLELSAEYALNLDSAGTGEFLDNDVVKGYVDAFYRGAVSPSKENDSIAVSLISTIEAIQVSYITELEKVQFFITYSDLSLTSTIIGDNNLEDNIYKVMTTVNHALVNGLEYEYINCSDGTIYAKQK